jgi:small subunit ribosomal protein S17
MAEQEEQTAQAEEAPQDDTEAAGEASADEETGDATADAPQADAPAAQKETATEGAAVVAAQAAVSEDATEDDGVRNMRKERVGVVVSDKMEKTIVVSIERSKKHPMYQKYLKRSARKMAHDENDDADEGDTVRIVETRPISKHKRWRLVEILERAA